MNAAASTDSFDSQRAFEVAVRVVRVEHTAVRSAGRGFVRAVESLGVAGLAEDDRALVTAYDGFARGLAHTFHELEEEVVDRIQVLHVQKRLQPGILERIKPRWMQLEAELLAHAMTLDELAQRFPSVQRELHPALSAFIASVRACVTVHRQDLTPAIAPLFGGHAWAA